jgi:rhodanese-related sulfurtransferase
MTTITASRLNALLREDPSLALIDVRTPLEFKQAHVPQALNIPLDSLAPTKLIESGQLPAEAPIYILCRSGQRAIKAAEEFSRNGFTNAIVVEGGTLAWIEAQLPVNRSETGAISLERQVRIAAGSIVLAGFLLGWFINPWFHILSGFVGAGLIFAGITDWCGMGLLIAKAPWNKR